MGSSSRTASWPRVGEPVVSPDEILRLLGVCCDGETLDALAATRRVLDAYEEIHALIDARGRDHG